MIEFRKAKHDVSGFITIQYRHVRIRTITDTIVVSVDDDGKPEWTGWQDIPYVNDSIDVK